MRGNPTCCLRKGDRTVLRRGFYTPPHGLISMMDHYPPDLDSPNNGFLGYAYFCFCATSGIDSWDMHVPLGGRFHGLCSPPLSRDGVHVHMRGGAPSEERCVQLGKKVLLERTAGPDAPQSRLGLSPRQTQQDKTPSEIRKWTLRPTRRSQAIDHDGVSGSGARLLRRVLHDLALLENPARPRAEMTI